MSEHDFFLSHLGQTTPFPFLVEVERAEGIYIYDKQGKAYMDMISGVAVNNIGHRHPKVVSALKNPKRQKARTENPVNMKAKGFLPAMRPSLNDKLFSIVFKILVLFSLGNI
jgi:4-aminobutyrate aminotransferase-like enzyme